MASELFLVFTNAVPGREDEFNRWYDDVHVPDILAIDGVRSAQRYRLQPSYRSDLAPNPTHHQYLTVYEVDRDGNEVLADMIASAASGAMTICDAFDMVGASMDSWVPFESDPSVRH